MRRIACCLVVPVAVVLVAVGCAENKKTASVDAADAEYADLYTLPEPAPADQTESYPTYGSPVVADAGYDNTYTPPSSGPRNHTVVRHDTLYGLARQYYGDHRRWRDIYEANRDSISDPNKIRVGQRLIIP